MCYWDGADGVPIAGDAWGASDDPLVVLLHGGGQTRHAWKGTGEQLAGAGYHAVSLDARGHGDSGWSTSGDYSQEKMIADLVAVVRQLGDPNPVLVGASMGGGVGLCAVGEGYVDASALVLVDMAPRIEVEGAERIMAFMAQKPDGFESLEDVADAISAYQPHRNRPRSLDGLHKNLRVGDRPGRYYWHWDPAFLNRTRDRFEERADRLGESAASLTLPTLLVRGGLSDVLSEAGAREFLEMCPHSEYVNVTDAAHMVAGDRNDLFTDAVIGFLGRGERANQRPNR